MPPAFILSQDQTLRKNFHLAVNITDLKRTWAHLPFTLQLLKFCQTIRGKILLAEPGLVKGIEAKTDVFLSLARITPAICLFFRAYVPADVIQM
jgi:hypothetical protein